METVSKTDGSSSATSETDSGPGPTAAAASRGSPEMSLVDVLSHSFLGIIFGEPGWPYPEVSKWSSLFKVLIARHCDHNFFFTLGLCPVLIFRPL